MITNHITVAKNLLKIKRQECDKPVFLLAGRYTAHPNFVIPFYYLKTKYVCQ